MESNLQTRTQGQEAGTHAVSGANGANRVGGSGDANGAAGAFVVPQVDIFENEEGITLLADLPGVSRDGLGVRVDGDKLFIEGSIATANGAEMELVYGEARASSYRRQFSLSRELDSTRINASLRNGLLKLTIPKAEVAKPRRIEVKVA